MKRRKQRPFKAGDKIVFLPMADPVNTLGERRGVIRKINVAVGGGVSAIIVIFHAGRSYCRKFDFKDFRHVR